MARRPRLAEALLLVALAAVPSLGAAQAQGYWLPTGDARLRDDVTLLVDENVIQLPTNAWPIPVQDLRAALRRTSLDDIHAPALLYALIRVRQRVAFDQEFDAEWQIHEVSLSAGRAGLLRDYGTAGRENAELSSVGGTTNDRWSMNIAATGALSPDDGQSLRLDGSDVTVRWGNWLFSANTLDRWWGPGHDGSLILSNNARPMMQLSLDRAQSTRFSVPILSFIGPWRFTGFVSAMERHRPDVDRALFMGMRFSFKPAQILEFGLSRTAQFCGENRPCGLSTFGNVILGRDNAGLRVRPEDEPGNQMAGGDVRIVSPADSLPIALYAQFIGEDGSSSGIPERYLGLMGIEGWWLRDSGTTVRATLEYGNTSCKWDQAGSNPDCAYRQGIFEAGYRYRGRTIGHTADTDSEMTSLNLRMVRSTGEEWGIHLTRARLDRYGTPDPFDPVTFGRGRHESLEVRWRGTLWDQDVGVQMGYERQSAGARGDDGLFGFLSWRHSL